MLLTKLAPTTLTITNSPGSSSSDLSTPETGDFGSLLGARYMCAEILQKEDPKYQEDMPTVCTISSSVPPTITFPANAITTQTFITAYGFDLASIESDFNAGICNM